MRPFAVASFTISLALALGCAPSPTAQLEANKTLVRQFADAANAADWPALEHLLTPDFRRHSEATPGVEVTSPQQFIDLQKSFMETAPDQHVTIDMLVAEGDNVAALATYSGTQTGPINGMPATGKTFALKFLAMFRIQDGKIAEMWVEWDNVAFLTQLGLFPPPGA